MPMMTGISGRWVRPRPAGTIDVVISNCVINLSVDKPAVFTETYRVLVPGGRIGVTDVVADDRLTPEQRAERGDYVGCIAGALTFAEYRAGLAAAGFTDIQITGTHPVADGMHSAIIRATKPANTAEPASTDSEAGSACCGVDACYTRGGSCRPNRHRRTGEDRRRIRPPILILTPVRQGNEQDNFRRCLSKTSGVRVVKRCGPNVAQPEHPGAGRRPRDHHPTTEPSLPRDS
jgi:SAM-dependent methyltransferase